MAMNTEALRRHAIEEDKGLVSVGGLAMRLAKESSEPSGVFGTLISFRRRELQTFRCSWA